MGLFGEQTIVSGATKPDTLVANYLIDHRVLANATGTGTVQANVAGNQATGIYLAAGTPVTLTAAPGTGAIFAGWLGDTNASIALTQDEHIFLDASIAERNRRESEEHTRQQRELESAQKLAETERQRAEEQTRSAGQLRKRAIYLAGAFVVALAMAIAAIFFGQQAQTDSRLATSRELAAASISNLDVDAERSILLALKALDSSHTTEAEDAQHRAIQASRLQLVIHAHEPGAASIVAFSPDGKQLVTAASDETVKIWDATTGEQSLKLEGHFAAYSPDGKRLAIVIPDGTVKVFDVVTGKQIQVPGQIDAKLSRAS